MDNKTSKNLQAELFDMQTDIEKLLKQEKTLIQETELIKKLIAQQKKLIAQLEAKIARLN